MSSTVPNVEEIEARERDLLSRLPFEAAHVPDSEALHWDAVFAEPFQSNGTISVYGELVVEAFTPLELKTCQRWIQDRHSGKGRRRGQFKLQQEATDALAEEDGRVAALVMEGDDILAGRIIHAEQVKQVVSSWTNGGTKYSSQRATISWPNLVPKSAVKEVSE